MRHSRSRLARPLLVVATLLAALFASGGASAQELAWVHRFGGEFFDLGLAVAADESGAYVAGAATNAIPGETAFGAQDAFIRKVNPTGAPLWTDQFGTSDFERIEGLAVDATGVYAAGWTRATLPGQQSSGLEDAFVRKYDPDGRVLWTTQFGSAAVDEALGIAADGSAVYVVGVTQGTLADGGRGGATDIFVRKLDRDGTVLWTTELGGAGPDTGKGIAVRDGALYVVGCTGWFCGSFNAADAYVARLRADDGSLDWERSFGAPFVQDEASGVAADATGIYVAGWTQGTLPAQTSAGFLDGYVRKYSADGAEAWTRQFGSSSDERVHGVAARGGVVYTAGVTGGALPGRVSVGFDDVFVQALDGGSGGDQWTLQFGSRDFETGRAITALSDQLYVAGDGVVFGPVVFPTTLPDAFVARITVDSTPPVLTVPAEVTADAVDPAGVAVSYEASAVDALDGAVPVACSPASGTTFPIGTTTVDCSATDRVGNIATATFQIRVRGADEQVADLIALLDGYGLDRLGTSLRDKLSTVQRLLAAGKPQQAQDNLEAFIAQVDAQRGKGMTGEQADALETAGQRILDLIVA